MKGCDKMSQRKYGHKKTYRSYNSKGEINKQQSISQKIDDMVSLTSYNFDPFGSYTGNPIDEFEVPVQDADDL